MLDWPEVTESGVPRKLELHVDARRWHQVRETCRRLAGRELTDTECLMMVTQHYLLKRGLHTRGL